MAFGKDPRHRVIGDAQGELSAVPGAATSLTQPAAMSCSSIRSRKSEKMLSGPGNPDESDEPEANASEEKEAPAMTPPLPLHL